MSRNRTLGAPYEQVGVTASFTTEAHVDRYLVSTPGGGPSVTVTLDPNAQDGDQVVVLDAAGNAVAHPITVVASAGQTIQGDATINIDGGSLELTFSVGLGLWTIRGTSDGVLASTPAFVDIKQFGPTDTADDTPTFQAAAAALAGTGQSLWLSAGTYNFVSLPVVPANLAIWSVGSVTFAGANAATIANQTLVYGQTPGTAGFCPAWFALTTIFINPTSGNDRAAGSTSGAPLKTWAEAIRRWGNNAPTILVSTVVTFQGIGHTDDSDPVVFAGLLVGGVSLTIAGSLIQQWTGTCTVVAAKNRATPQLLDLTLPAGAAANQFVINTTHPSHFFVYKASAGNWLVSQPMLVPAPPFGMFSPAEVNTTTTGDAVTGFTLTAINIQQLTPVVADESAADTNNLFVTQCTVFDPFPGRSSSTFVNLNVIFSDCLVKRLLTVTVGVGPSTSSSFNSAGCVNVVASGSLQLYLPPSSGPFFFFLAGVSNDIFGQAYGLDADTIVAGAFNSAIGSTCNLGAVYFETGSAFNIRAIVTVASEGFAGVAIWGPGGAIDVQQTGHMQYPAGAGAATAVFLQTVANPLALNGVFSGSSSLSGSPTVINGGISLTPGHLDASPAGAAAFNGNAFALGNASISNLGG